MRGDRTASTRRGLTGLVVAILLATTLPASAQDSVIALGLEVGSSETHPPMVGPQGGARFGTALAGLPDGAGAILHGGRLVDGGLAEADTWLWDGASWQAACGTDAAPVACGPGPRSFAATATATDQVLLYGGTTTGIDDNGVALGDAFAWRDGGWQNLCIDCPPGPRVGASMAGSGDVVLLFGGFDQTAFPPARTDTWLFDGEAWTRIHPGGADAPPGRIGAHFAWDGSRFVLFGGASVPDGSGPDLPLPLDDTWAWDGESWTRLCGGDDDPCGPPGRFLGGFAHLEHPDPEREGALLAGGFVLVPTTPNGFDDGENNFPEFFDDLWFWSGERWTRLGSPWVGGAIPEDEDGGLPLDLPEVPIFPALASTPADCTATLVAAFSGAFASDEDPGRTWTIGFDRDRDGAPDRCPEAEEVGSAPVVGVAFEDRSVPGPSFSSGVSHPKFRFLAGFSATPGGRETLLYGGMFLDGEEGGGVAESDTWLWDGEEWSALCGVGLGDASAPCGPGPRVLHGMAVARDGVLLYGGSASAGPGVGLDGALGDAFWWQEGRGWAPLCTDCAPGPRMAAAIASDGESVLLFGGARDESTLLGDTWLFADGVWTLLDAGSVDGPPPSLGAQLAWDGTQWVLFGGLAFDESGEPSRFVAPDTWVWDGARWVAVCRAGECGPGPRVGGGFSYLASPDPDGEGALLVGGFDDLSDDFGVLGDTWFWDRTRWVKLGGPFVDRVLNDEQTRFLVPAFGVSASRPTECSVAIAAVVPAGDSFHDAVPEMRTWDVGFDRDGDARTDPCPEASPEPSPTPSPTPSPSVDPGSGPGPEESPAGGRIAVAPGRGRVPRVP